MLLLLLLVLLLLRGTEIEGWGREEARPNERLHGHRCVRKKRINPATILLLLPLRPPPPPPPLCNSLPRASARFSLPESEKTFSAVKGPIHAAECVRPFIPAAERSEYIG